MDTVKKGIPFLLPPILIFALGLIVLTTLPVTRAKLYQLLQKEEREVLARVDGDLSGQGDLFEIVKIKSSEGIILEVYRREMEGVSYFTTLTLDEKRDGYFDFQGAAVNLALTDIDKDGALELVTATYDENLMPRLYAFRYHKEAQQFEKLGPENLRL